MKYPHQYERQHDGKRFQVRVLGDKWQVYGVGLEHICECTDPEVADMIADALEAKANSDEELIDSVFGGAE